jgi:pyruvate/2-oxoglutarate dehydrogenase complex dihydrolipoamide acyltransferase (E2) component
MPQLGESVAEGTIGKWLKNVGDHVDKYEPIVEVITDKVNAEVPSPFEGTLTEILVKEGETVPNLAEIAVIEAVGDGATPAPAAAGPGGAASAAAPNAVAGAEAVADEVPAGASAERTVLGTGTAAASAAAAPAAPVAHGPAGSDERTVEEMRAQPSSSNGTAAVDAYEGRMTPAVRRLAREHGVDLSKLQGSGHAGRVTREDVLRYVEGGGAPATASPAPSAAATQPAPAATQAPTQTTQPTQPAQPSPVAEGDSLKVASPMRKAIATQMTRALQVPVAYTLVEVDMSAVARFRDKNKAAYQAQEGIALSYVAFVTKAAVEALRRHPDFNAHYTDEGHWRRKRVNVGVAVAVDDGLIVPVIHDADQLSIHGLNKAIHDLADRSRSNKLRLDDIQGGTFTVDNTGWTGSVITMPIINSPEVGILTMEAIVKRPVVVETPQGDAFAVRPIMNMVLGFDHRATDGAQAGQFLGAIKRWLESVDGGTPIW